MTEIILPQKKLSSRLKRAVARTRDADWAHIILFATTHRETAYCTHLVFAALFFSPFLLFGQVLAANQDLLLENYPMLLLAKQNFLHGSLGLWNPYSFAGVPQAVEANTPLFFPENWLLFLVPMRFLFSTITFFAFVKFWLVGVAAYEFYCAELLNRRWAFFASVSLQLSGTTIWFLGTYVGLSIELYYLILLALIWTSTHRSALANYLLWSLVTSLLLMAGDIAHSAYALLGAGILILYRSLSLPTATSMLRQLALFTATSVTALLVFCIRLLPIVQAVHSSFVINDCCRPEFTSASFLIAQLFDPEILGVNFVDSQTIFANISPRFHDWHLHAVGIGFYGIAAALGALWMLVSEKPAKAIFWSVFVIVGLGFLLFAQPFDALVSILLSPVRHRIGIQTMYFVGMPILAAIGGMTLERNARSCLFPRVTLQIVAFFAVVFAMFILMILFSNIAPLSAVGSNYARALLIVIALLASLLLWARRVYPRALNILGFFVLCGILICAIVIVLFWTDSNRTFLSHLKNIGVQLLLFSILSMFIVAALRGRADQLKQTGVYVGAVAFLVCLAVVVYPWTDKLRLAVPLQKGLVLAGLGGVLFLLGLTNFFLLLRAVKLGRLPARGIYIVMLGMLVFELVPGDKINGHIAANPFYDGVLYPRLRPLVDNTGQPLDLSDYRVNLPNTLLQLPFYNELFGTNEICASANVAYGIRSYGGYTDAIPQRVPDLYTNWAKPEMPTEYCVYAHQKNASFLDLLAVGYQYDPNTSNIIRRPGALSRFMLFTNYQTVLGVNAELAHLKDSAFRPLDEIMLEASPGFGSRVSGANGRKLTYSELNSDHIELTVRSENPALVLFDDSFSQGWSAKVNGRAGSVMRANYNFMAIPIPAGESHIVLVYWPKAFKIGAMCTIAGLTLLAIAFALFVLRGVRAKHSMAAT